MNETLKTLSSNWLPLDSQDAEFSRHLFRRTFDVTELPDHAPVAITAGHLYRLTVNGIPLLMGPARSNENFLFVDEWDIAQYLQKGTNLIAIEVAWYECPVPRLNQFEFASHEGGLGLVLNLNSETLVLDEKWRTLKLDCFSENAPWSRGLRSEYLFAEKFPTNWNSIDYVDASWKCVENSKLQKASKELRPRATPLFPLKTIYPEKVVDSGFMELSNSGGARNQNQLDRIEYRNVCTAFTGGDRVILPRSPQEGPLILKGGKSLSGYAVYAFDGDVPGTVEVKATIPSGARLDINLMEWLSNEDGAPLDRHQRLFPGMVGNGGITLIGDGKDVEFASMLQHNFRYICLVGRDLSDDQEIRIHSVRVLESCGIDAQDVGADVLSSDPVLNQIVEAAKRTIRVNAHDYYVDCTCERVVTSGDCLQSSEGGRLFYGETGRAISRTMFDLFVDQGLGYNENWTHLIKGRTVAVTRQNNNAGWMLATCMLMLDIVAYFQENSESLSPKYEAIGLGLAEDVHRNLSKENLIPSDRSMMNWSDWSKMVVSFPESAEEGISVSVNAYFFRLFSELSNLYPDVEIYSAITEKMREGIRRLLSPFIDSDGPRIERFVPDFFYREGGKLLPFDVKEANTFGYGTRITSETTQYWLLWSRVLTKSQELRLWEVLSSWKPFEISHRDNTRLMNPSRASSLMGLCPRYRYMLEKGDAGLYAGMRDAFKENVLRDATLWEGLEQDSRSNAHATTAYAGIVLYRALTGIYPGDTPDSLVISPLVDASIEWVRGSLTVNQGTVGVAWRFAAGSFRLRVGLPKGMSATVVLPRPVLSWLSSGTIDPREARESLIRCSTEITVRETGEFSRREIGCVS